jgi:hypothetical protein
MITPAVGDDAIIGEKYLHLSGPQVQLPCSARKFELNLYPPIRLDLDFLRLFSQFFVPDLNRIIPRRHIRELKTPVVLSYAVVRILRGKEPAAHPAMDVALTLIISGFSIVTVSVFLNFGCAKLNGSFFSL